MKNNGKNIIANVDIYRVKCICDREFLIVDNGDKWECKCGFIGGGRYDFIAYTQINRISIYGHGAIMNNSFNRPFTYVERK